MFHQLATDASQRDALERYQLESALLRTCRRHIVNEVIPTRCCDRFEQPLCMGTASCVEANLQMALLVLVLASGRGGSDMQPCPYDNAKSGPWLLQPSLNGPLTTPHVIQHSWKKIGFFHQVTG